jgi:hypothetical protein
MLPYATQAGTAAATPWKKRPKYTAMTEGTAAVMTEKTQKTAEETMYSVRRPKVSDIGAQTMPPRVWPSRYMVTKANTPRVLLMWYSSRAESDAAV